MTHCVNEEEKQLFMLPELAMVIIGAHANDEKKNAFNDLVDKSWIDRSRN